MAVVCHEAVFLMLFSAADYTHTLTHDKSRTEKSKHPSSFFHHPKPFYSDDTAAATVHSVSLHGAEWMWLADIQALCSLSSQTVTLWMASAVVQIVWPRAGHKIAGLWKLLYFSPSSILLLPSVQIHCVCKTLKLHFRTIWSFKFISEYLKTQIRAVITKDASISVMCLLCFFMVSLWYAAV